MAVLKKWYLGSLLFICFPKNITVFKEKIKQLEQMQENLFHRIRIKSYEYELLKQNETNLIATNTELYNTI